MDDTEIKPAPEDNIKGNAPDAVVLSEGEKADAIHEGAIEDAKETGKDAHHALTDGALPGDPQANPYPGWDEIQMWAHNLDLGIDAFKDRIALKTDKDGSVPDEKVYGLLALERNGKNRTPYVKAMMDRLDLDADKLPGGGPGYTNDISSITKL